MNKSSNPKKSKKKKEKDFLEKLEAQNSALKKIISSFKNGFKHNSDEQGGKNLIFSFACLLFVFVLSFNFVQAEEPASKVLSSAGGCYTASGATLEWTLGEPAVNSYNSGNLLVSQGFHQPAILSTLIREFTQNNIKVFPNPFSSDLNLKLSGSVLPGWAVILDVTGKEIIKFQIQSPEKQLHLSQLQTGIYFLKLIGEKGMLTVSLIKK